MAYEKPIQIKEAITSIEDGHYVLPSIQREFVWDSDQMVTLFDSLMRDYPISTFLFWQVKANDVKRFKFYRFLDDYHERDNRHNPEAKLSGKKDIIAILDGQQRLTSIYIALCGSYATKLNYYRRSSDHAYPEKRMYLNLLSPSDDVEKEYNFQFLTDEEASVCDAESLWFKVGDILKFENVSDSWEWVTEKLDDLSDSLPDALSKETKKFARNTFAKLYKVVCEDDTLNFFLEKSDKLDKVLQIFIRINQGGTKLSYSDLLLSIATAQWQKLDARKEIHGFVDRINDVGKGFNFNKDFVLKSCLVLADIKDIKFKVDNFSSENMTIIEKQWGEISGAINLAIQLAAHFGFDGKTLTSTNAIIPIAYFLKKKGIGEKVLHSESHAENRECIRQWLLRVLLKKSFGGQPDSLYPVYRRLVNDGGDTFPLAAAIAEYSGKSRTLDFYEPDIDLLLGVDYGSAYAFMLLSLFCPINHDYEFHQDHIHPKKLFYQKSLKAEGISTEAEREQYVARFNKLPNLQLLQATPNIEKQAKKLNEWLDAKYPETVNQQRYKDLHLFPGDQSTEFTNFVGFYEGRKALIRARLMELLKVKVSKEDAPSYN